MEFTKWCLTDANGHKSDGKPLWMNSCESIGATYVYTLLRPAKILLPLERQSSDAGRVALHSLSEFSFERLQKVLEESPTFVGSSEKIGHQDSDGFADGDHVFLSTFSQIYLTKSAKMFVLFFFKSEWIWVRFWLDTRFFQNTTLLFVAILLSYAFNNMYYKSKLSEIYVSKLLFL